MVDTERMKRVLDRLIPPPPGPALPPPPPPVHPGPFPGPNGPHGAEASACPEWIRQEGELEKIFLELGRRSRPLSGLMDRLRSSSRRRRSLLRRFCSPERLPPFSIPMEWGREGVYRMLRRAYALAEDLERGYQRASGRGGLPVSLERSAGETRRTLERTLRRIRG